MESAAAAQQHLQPFDTVTYRCAKVSGLFQRSSRMLPRDDLLPSKPGVRSRILVLFLSIFRWLQFRLKIHPA